MSKHGKSNTDKVQVDNLNKDLLNDSNFAGLLNEITIDLKKACESKPHPKMIEECKPSIK